MSFLGWAGSSISESVSKASISEPPMTSYGELDFSKIRKCSIVELGQEISSEYRKNPIAAEEKYFCKWIYTIGTIFDISKKKYPMFGDEVYVVRIYDCYSGGAFELNCEIADKDSILNLRKGDKIAVCGTFIAGFRDSEKKGFVTDCTFIKKLEK